MAAFKSSIVLGQLVHPGDIKDVEELAEIEFPTKLADRKLNKLIMARYKLIGVKKQMVNIIGEDNVGTKLQSMEEELDKLEKKIAKAAENLVTVSLEAYDKRKKLRQDTMSMKSKQNRISMNIESPIDFTLSNVAQFPIAYDGLEFDVQYFRNEEVEDKNKSSVKQKTTTQSNQKKFAKDGIVYGKDKDGKDIKITKGDKTLTKDQQSQYEKDEAKYKSLTSGFKEKITSFIGTFLQQGEDTTMHDDTDMATMPAGASSNTTTNMMESVHSTLTEQSNSHLIGGTLVIVARCNHKNADIISPCILDSGKMMTAWNYLYPDNSLTYGKADLFNFVFSEEQNPPKPTDDGLHLLTGCTRYSSFVGMAHVLKSESTSSSQNTTDTVAQIKSIIQKEQVVGTRTGTTSERMKNAAKQANNLLSSAQIFNHASLVTMGIIPNIAASEVSTTVQQLQTSPGEQLQALSAIQKTGETALNDFNDNSNASNIKEAKTGAELVGKSNEFATNTVAAITDKESVKNMVIDTNSLMTAFTDYITKAQAGSCGVPSTFFIQKINKYDVAKAYLRDLYPTASDAGKEGQDGLKATGGYKGQFA